MDHVKYVLSDVKRVYPAYDSKQGYELAGFVWFQGWNDMVNNKTYPHTNKPGRYDEYANLMGHFIRDVRKDLSAPNMPVVIGVMGVDGIQDKPNDFRLSLPRLRQNNGTHRQGLRRSSTESMTQPRAERL